MWMSNIRQRAAIIYQNGPKEVQVARNTNHTTVEIDSNLAPLVISSLNHHTKKFASVIRGQ
jgi:hypothetical protein